MSVAPTDHVQLPPPRTGPPLHAVPPLPATGYRPPQRVAIALIEAVFRVQDHAPTPPPGPVHYKRKPRRWIGWPCAHRDCIDLIVPGQVCARTIDGDFFHAECVRNGFPGPGGGWGR